MQTDIILYMCIYIYTHTYITVPNPIIRDMVCATTGTAAAAMLGVWAHGFMLAASASGCNFAGASADTACCPLHDAAACRAGRRGGGGRPAAAGEAATLQGGPQAALQHAGAAGQVSAASVAGAEGVA